MPLEANTTPSTFNSVVFTKFCLRLVKFSLNSNRICFSQIEDRVYTNFMALVVFVNASVQIETDVFLAVNRASELFSYPREHYEYIRKNSKKPGEFQ
ncbi:hypothetical protein THOB06_220007 [Vibrio rotiferianus]|uniref:Uncharacterized protein n=1 Tax=Vibrio rotiferianus TaxID=190895 RepID=A0A7Y3ZCJ4_9VIBR|nr:hypothetical protein [Vibrio rotiferianus]CAH1574062.1 hypothetical protein THOG10_220007 [Vibrio rotiferianus]CAH1576039.1 hypothetical protein THOB06_220007 [Vibrio rotiferianus]CAH1581987.1 hypothetical protein THOE12_60281 [Vibrio rotiferianus]